MNAQVAPHSVTTLVAVTGVATTERHRPQRHEAGQSLAELALLLPLLLLIVLGAVDWGRVYFAYVSVTNAARNAADYASDSPDAAADLAGIEAAVRAETGDLLDISADNPDLAVVTGTDSQGHLYAEVTVRYTFSTLFPWPGLPDAVNVERTLRTRVADQ